MKIRILLCVMLALLAVFLLACRQPSNDTDTDTDTSVNCDTQSDTNTDTQADTSTDTDTDTETDTDTDTNTDTDSDTDTDTDIDTDTDTELEPEPDPKPAPVDVTIKLFENGISEYTIVYPKNNDVIEAQVKQLVGYIKSAYNVDIPYKAVDRNMDEADKEIVIGLVRENVYYATSKMYTQNDFVLDVCDNDYVIYAPNDALYSYAFRIFKDEILPKTENGALNIEPDEGFLFRKSEYKDMNFASYVKAKADKASFDKDLLCQLFVDMSFTATDNTTLPYRLYLPSNYDSSEAYPVIVFLHGAGERGNDNYSHMGNMVHNMFNQKNSSLIENAIVICPQCPWNNQWVDTPWENGNYSIDSVPESNELKAVVELLGKIKNQFSTDEDRYYAMGISMGGFGTWDLLMRHSDIFAAGVPVCGGADVSQAEGLKNMPIYTAHAANDWSVPYAGTEAMVKALKEAGSTQVIFKNHADGTLSSGGHIIWGEIGDDPKMLEWLFNQNKSEQKNDNELPSRPILGENGTPAVLMN